MDRLVSLFLVAGLAPWAAAGCEEDGSKSGPAASASAAPKKPAGGLMVGDVPTKVASSFVIGTKGDTSWRLVMATGPLDCKALMAAYPTRPPLVGDALMVDIGLAQAMEASGADGPWEVRGASVTDAKSTRSLVTRAGMVEDVVHAGDQVAVRGLELALQERAHTGKQIMWDGAVQAQHCGRVARPEPNRPQGELTLHVAGQKVAVHGASLRPRKDKVYLRLTQVAHDCDSQFTTGYDFYLDLAYSGDPPRLQLASLQGARFPGAPAGSEGKDSFTIEPAGPLEEGAEVGVAISGTLKLNGYEVKAAGKVSALSCPAPSAAAAPAGSAPKK